MKKLYLLLVIAIPCNLLAQSDKKVDSLDYYNQELGRLWKNAIDSLRNSEEYKAAYESYVRNLKTSKGYHSFVLFADITHTDFSQFNAMLAQDGFPALKEIGYRFGFGGSRKFDRFLVDFYFMSIGIGNKTEKGNEWVRAGFSNALIFDFGYAVLDKSFISIYPYAGISGRSSHIKYRKGPIPNPNYTSITNMFSDRNDVNLESTRIGYQLGVGVDLTLFQNKQKTSRFILFTKGGMNRPMWKDKFKQEGLPTYQPNIKNGDWMITVGVKIATKG